MSYTMALTMIQFSYKSETVGKLFIVENYLEAVGIMHSLKAGNDPKTVRRPIPRIRILENKETIESSPQVYTGKK